MEVLKDIEEIKKLKARYFRFLDSKNWDDLGRCLTNDVLFSYPPQEIKVEGRAGLIENFKKRHAITQTAHTGSMPEIDLLDDNNAKGVWFMTDYIITPSGDGKTISQGFGHYFETYQKEQGEWKIKTILLERLLITQPDAALINIQ